MKRLFVAALLVVSLNAGVEKFVQVPTLWLSWESPTTNVIRWDRSDDADGYALYVGSSSRQYAQRLDVGDTTSSAAPILAARQTFYTVTAYNTAGESDGSGEVVYTPPLNISTKRPANITLGRIVIVEQSLNLTDWTFLTETPLNALEVPATGAQKFFRIFLR